MQIYKIGLIFLFSLNCFADNRDIVLAADLDKFKVAAHRCEFKGNPKRLKKAIVKNKRKELVDCMKGEFLSIEASRVSASERKLEKRQSSLYFKEKDCSLESREFDRNVCIKLKGN